MSELSTVAIKDGHRGHPHHLQTSLISDLRVPGYHTNPDSERADRISRLAGLERLGAVRASSSSSLPPGASANNPSGLNHFERAYMIPPGGVHHLSKERSTVGSASATASVGDAGSAYTFDGGDKMSGSGSHSQSQSVGGDAIERDAMDRDDMDDMEAGTVSSVGFGDAMSDNASLVGWAGGERAGSPGPAASVMASQGSKMGTPAGTPAPERFGGRLGGGEDARMD